MFAIVAAAAGLQPPGAMRPSLALLLSTACLAACATARGRADDAFVRADYLAAAAQYDALLDRTPGDAELLARRDQSRSRALTGLAMQARDARLAGKDEAALGWVAEVLRWRDEWPGAAGTWTVETIAVEAAAARDHVRAEVQRAITAGQPLGAEQILAVRRARLDRAELAALWPALTAQIQALGEQRCGAVAPADVEVSPYLSRLTAAYCLHFGVARPSAARLPDTFAGTTTDGAISGMTPMQRVLLDAALDTALRASPWFEVGAGAPRAEIVLAGSQSATFAAAEVTLEAPWTEYVQYTEREAYQESYQEAYSDQESYTTYSTESYSCGYGTNHQTCTRSVPRTEYRTVTRYRTAYRTAYRDVTRTRAEPRVHVYPATQHTGRYTGAWSLSLGLRAEVATDLVVRDADQQSGYEHDEVFPAASVSPQRVDLPSFDAWSSRLVGRVTAELPARLAAQWSASFCRSETYTAETAARCAHGGTWSPQARAALAPLFGGDADRVLAAFAQK